MNTTKQRAFRPCLLLAVLFSVALSAKSDVDESTLFLTWQDDPTSTMTIQWMEPGTVKPLTSGQKDYEAYNIPYAAHARLDQIPETAYEVQLLATNQPELMDRERFRAEARMAWDDKGLFVWLDVYDDKPLESDRLSLGDSVSLMVSTGIGDDERYRIDYAPGWDDDFPEPRLQVHDFRTANEAEVATTFQSISLDGGYRVAARLPLNDFGLTPEDGLQLALQFYVNRGHPEHPWTWLGWHRHRLSIGDRLSYMPVRLSAEADAPYRVRGVVDKEGDDIVLELTAVPEQAGQELRLMAGEWQLGTVELKAGNDTAQARFVIPNPPSGERWGTVRVYDGEQRLAQSRVPGWMAGVEAPNEMQLHYFKEGERDSVQAVAATLSKLEHWDAYYLHRVELTGLDADTLYRFHLGDAERSYAFRTMPASNDRPVRFAVGGDTRHRQEWMEEVNRQAMKYDLDFIAWGGDFAYADGMHERLYRWHEWFDAIANTLVRDDGRMLPIVGTIGNHEVTGGYYTRYDDYEQTDEWRMKIAPYFYQLFAFPGQPGWGVLDFGDYLSMLVLDTDHANPIEGRQTEWLKEALDERVERFNHIIPMYHVPAYPSVRNFAGGVSTRVRDNWVPLFEEAGVRVAFENHDHAYKRTHPIRSGDVHREGIVYVGDGAWGVGERDIHSVYDTWYLARAESMRHAIIVTVDGPHLHLEVISREGHIIDDLRLEH